MKKIPILVIFLCISITVLNAQNSSPSIRVLDSLAALAYKDADFLNATLYAEQSVALAATKYGKEDTLYTKGLMTWGSYLQQIGKYDTAKTLYFEALKRNQTILPPKHPLLLTNKQYISNVFFRTGPVETTEKYLKEVRDLTLEQYGMESIETISAYHNLGLFYSQIGRMEDAENLLLQSLNLGIKLRGSELHPDLESTYISVAYFYKKSNRLEKSEKMYKKAQLIVQKKWGKSHSNYGRILNNMGQLYRSMKRYDVAEKMYLKGLKIRKATLGSNHYRVATVHGNLAGMYSLNKRFEEAVVHAKEAVRINTIALGKKHARVGIASFTLSNALLALKRSDEALEAIYSGLNANCFGEVIDAATPLDKIATEYVFQSNNLTIELLNLWSKIFLKKYYATKKLSDLEQCFEIRKAISNYLKRTQAELVSAKDKLNLLSQTARMAQQSVSIAYMLYKATNDKQYITAILSISEDSKSAVLTSALQSDKALVLGAVPDSLIEQEYATDKLLSTIYKSLVEAENKKDSLALAAARKALLLAKIKKDSLRKVLEQNFPKYNQLKYAIPKTNLGAIQKKVLNRHTALVEYFVLDTAVYTLLVRSDAIYCHQIPFEKGVVVKKVEAFRKSLSNYSFILNEKEKANALYKKMAHFFYQKLIQPIQPHLRDIENLIVIPDGVLGHIPFEALLIEPAGQSKATNWTELHYLIDQLHISYSYSAALLLEGLEENVKKDNNGQIAAYAASYTGITPSEISSRSPEIKEMRGNLIPLEAVEQEVRALEKLFGFGHFLYGKEANEKQFKSTAENYAIIHLAMHGLLTPEEPMNSSLAFTEDGGTTEDNFLAAYEIANLRLNADLVVLSACETGYGKFQQGEGIMSLARSFMYAGAPSLIVSLWQVNDNSTAIIMKSFYENLIEGMPKDKALSNAKETYIKTTKGVIGHPAFWSPFIQLGNRAPITIKKQSYWWWIAIGGVLSLLVLIWGGRKWRRQS